MSATVVQTRRPKPREVMQRDAIAKAFSRAAAGYDQNAQLQQMTGQRLLSQWRNQHYVTLADLGTGTGYFVPMLAKQADQVLGLDLACGMLGQAKRSRGNAAFWLAADALQLPLADESVDGVFSNLALQWVADLPTALDELHRVLKPGGQALFTTLLDGTLDELKRAWAKVDNYPHVNRFISGPELSEHLAGSPFARYHCEPIVHQLPYLTVRQLLKSLKGVGATHVPGRHRGLFNADTLRRLEQAYPHSDAGVSASWHVAYIKLEKAR